MGCLTDDIFNEEGFKKLRELYPDVEPGFLKKALQYWRELKKDREQGFPLSGAEKGSFTKILKYKKDLVRGKSKEAEIGIDELIKRYNELNDIYDVDELFDRVHSISTLFSRKVNSHLKESGNPRMKRSIAIVQLGGFRGIMNSILADYKKYSSADWWFNGFKKRNPDRADEECMAAAEYRAAQYQKMVDHFDALVEMASREISSREPIVIKFNRDSESFDVEEDALSEDKPQNNTEDGEGAKGDRFVDYRTVSLNEILSWKTKSFLGLIEDLDEFGHVRKTKLGETVTMDDKTISYKLLEIFSTLDLSRDYVEQLKEYSNIYPWIRGIVSRLEKDPDMKTYLFCDFFRVAYKYTNIRLNDDGKSYRVYFENTSNLQNAFMRNAGNTMRSGRPLDSKFSVYGDDGLITKKERTEAGNDEYAPDKVKGKLQELVDKCDNIFVREDIGTKIPNPVKRGNEYATMSNPHEAMKQLLEDWDKDGTLDYIIGAFRGVGADITKEQLKDAAMTDLSESTGRILKKVTKIGGIKNNWVAVPYAGNRLAVALSGLSDIYGTVDKVISSGNTEIDKLYYNNDFQDKFMGINIAVAPSLVGNVEPSTLSGKNRLQTYNRPNLIHTVFDVFKKGGLMDSWLKQDPEHGWQRFMDYMNENYLDCEGYTIKKTVVDEKTGEIREVDVPTGWLASVMAGAHLELTDATTFNAVEYADMNAGQKITSAIVRFFQNTEYEVNIMADYGSAYNFVQAYKLDIGKSKLKDFNPTKITQKTVPFGDVEVDGRSNLVEAVIDEVLSEIRVVKAAKERLDAYERGEWEIIGNGKENDGYDKRSAQFNLFKEFNDNGFLDAYEEADPDNMPAAAREVVRNYVVEQLNKIVKEDLEYFFDLGIYNNRYLVKTLKLDVSREKDGVVKLNEASIAKMIDFSLNNLYARQQMTKILNGGLAQFGSIVEFEKRSMMNHAPHTPYYKYATWNGKRVDETGKQLVAYVDDSVVPSNYIEEIGTSLNTLKDRLGNDVVEAFKGSFKKTKETDGQGFRTLPSFRRVMICTARWTDSLEESYNRIASGKWERSDVIKMINAIEYYRNTKPFYGGYEFIDGLKPGDKKIKLSVSHKYAETILLPEFLLDKTTKGASTPYRGLSKAAEQLGVDMIICTSGVKTNAHAVAKDVFNAKKNHSSDDIAKSIVDQITANPHAKHELDLQYYGEAAATPVHVMDSKISWAAQAELMALADMEDKDECVVGGKSRSGSWVRDTLDKIKASETLAAYRELQQRLEDPVELEKLLQEELADKNYNSPELKFALRQIRGSKFALPLFAPSVKHQVQQLILSTIKKRILRHKTKGANIFQSTSFGLDTNVVEYKEEGLGKNNKLEIVWENKGKPNQRIKYVECFVPITDSWLYKFADDKGQIEPQRLRELTEAGIIPESILYSVGYRTPSDGVHSLLPLKIKGFTSNVEGANIILPKEAMTLAGLDFDGDKFRVHFKNFDAVWDDDAIHTAYDAFQARLERGALSKEDRQILRFARIENEGITGTDDEIMKVILGQSDTSEVFEDISFEEFEKGYKHKRRNSYRNLRLQEVAYDIDGDFQSQSPAARDNARVDLLFSVLTSPAGTAKMLIPGGAVETAEMAKRLYLVRNMNEPRVNQELKDAGILRKDDDAFSLSNKLDTLDNDQLDKLIDSVQAYDTPFSTKHAAQAHERITGGKQLVSVFAKENAITQIFQRLHLRYVPRTIGKDKDVTTISVKPFGKEIDRLYRVRNNDGHIASRLMSRLLNAAVDNAKEPILGMVNQCKELASLTAFLAATGMSERQLHIIMTQPVIVEIANRLKSKRAKNFSDAVVTMIGELSGAKEPLRGGEQISWTKKFNNLTEKDFINCIPATYGEAFMKSGELNTIGVTQLAVLHALFQISGAVSELQTISGFARPDSESGAIDISAAENIITKCEFTDYLTQEKEHRIIGTDGFIGIHEIDTTENDKKILDEINGPIKYISLLNSLFYETSDEFLVKYFPEVSPSWQKAILATTGLYNYSSKYESTVHGIVNEMVIWKLLSSPLFVDKKRNQTMAEAVEEKRDYYVLRFPKKFADKLAEIKKSKKDDPLYDLRDNLFLKKFVVDNPLHKSGTPRIRFVAGGPSIGGYADRMRSEWASLLKHSDPEVVQIAKDLYIYNLYTSGFGYGMYEFAHLAPFSVLASIDNYIQSLNNLNDSDMGIFETIDSDSFKNWTNQYYCNHWDDSALVPHVKAGQIPAIYKSKFGMAETDETNSQLSAEEFVKYPFITVVTYVASGDSVKAVKEFYRRVGGKGEPYNWVKAPKLGRKGKHGVAFLQYNPNLTLDNEKMQPIAIGEDSEYGQADENGFLKGARSYRRRQTSVQQAERGQVTSNGKPPVLHTTSRVAEEADAENEEVLKEEEGKKDSAPEAVSEVSDNSVTGQEERVSPNPEQPVEAPVDEQPLFAVGGVSAEVVSNFLAAQKAKNKLLQIAETTINEDGTETVTKRSYPVNPKTLREARRQRAYVSLHNRLIQILREKGVAVGVLDDFEKRLRINGVADFDAAKVTADGLVELIRLAEGVGGIEALPEEFSHLAIEMLGHDHPLVKRLLSSLSNNEEALREAYGGMYDVYKERYSSEFADTDEGNRALNEKLVLEAAGKLVAKQLLYEEEVQTSGIRKLIGRIVNAIKEFFRKFNRRRIQDDILDSEGIASELARNIMSGRLLDEMSLEKVKNSGKYLKATKDLSKKEDIMSRLLKDAVKRRSIYEARLRFDPEKTKTAVINIAQREIGNLEESIEKLTVQQGIYKYLNDSLATLGQIEDIYDTVVSGDYDVSKVCRYLRIYQDTIYSVASGLNEIDKSLRDSEIEYDEDIRKAMDTVNGALDAFSVKYQRQAMMHFEELLSNVYGRHGKTVTIGREKGKVISIHDMARRAEHDISLASRYFHALADCNDLALKAFDDTTRNAKKNARKRTAKMRARIEEAFERLVREEGSRDQSFMFKYKIENGKRVKNGEYISEEESKKLSPAKKHFYDVMMDIKHEIDSYLPESEVKPLKIVMISKTHVERAMQSDSVKEGAIDLAEGIKNSILDTSDDIDYENENIRVDFAGNRIDMLPIHYVHKNPKLTFDDMSDDVASTILAYANMGNEYDELSSVVDWLEVSKDMAARRQIVQKNGRRVQIEKIGDDESDYTYSQPFTRSQVHSHMQDALNDFFYMHLYGGLQRNEGTIGNTRIEKRKAANMLNHFASLSQMAVNLQQRISNVGTGLSMIVIESAGKGEFSAKDVVWGNNIWWKHAPDRLLGFGSTNNDNKLSLWIDYHDVTNDNGREEKNKRYGKSRAKRVLNENLLYSGMLAGEDYLAAVTSLALAKNFKVINTKTGKTETLWDAYEVAYIDPANKSGAYLKLKDGYTKTDGSAITEEDEKRFSKRVSGVNFELQGIYNLDDKSAVQQYALGALVIMYRKWIAPALKRRYGGVDYSILKEQDVEGYYRTAFRLFGDAYNNIKIDGQSIMASVKTAWGNMNDYERGNCRKALTEMAIVLGCVVAIAGLSKWQPDDDDDEDKTKFVTWLDHQFLYQLMRLRNEVGSQAPTPMLVDEASKILKSPMAATRPLAAGLDAFQLLIPTNYFTEVRSGRYKGHTKAHKYFFDLPIISMTRNLHNFEDPSSLIKFYNSKSY